MTKVEEIERLVTTIVRIPDSNLTHCELIFISNRCLKINLNYSECCLANEQLIFVENNSYTRFMTFRSAMHLHF